MTLCKYITFNIYKSNNYVIFYLYLFNHICDITIKNISCIKLKNIPIS